jgi:predicted Fe-Mo cluster-binding NifX family protein
MKIAISVDEKDISGIIQPKFGRCNYFLIAEIENEKIKDYNFIENEGTKQAHGAGIKAAEQIANLNVENLITGQLGPNATLILEKVGIVVYEGRGEIKENINKLINNDLKLILKNEDINNKELIEKNEKIFFPLLEDNRLKSKISQHFGHAPFFGLYNVQTKELKIIKNTLDHSNENLSPIEQIQKLVNPTTIFAKAIGQRAIDIISQKGLKLKSGNFETIKDAIENLEDLNDNVECCKH